MEESTTVPLIPRPVISKLLLIVLRFLVTSLLSTWNDGQWSEDCTQVGSFLFTSPVQEALGSQQTSLRSGSRLHIWPSVPLRRQAPMRVTKLFAFWKEFWWQAQADLGDTSKLDEQLYSSLSGSTCKNLISVMPKHLGRMGSNRGHVSAAPGRSLLPLPPMPSLTTFI